MNSWQTLALAKGFLVPSDPLNCCTGRPGLYQGLGVCPAVLGS